MARMPGVGWEGEHAPVQPNGQRRLMTRYDIVCVHTIVGQAPAHAAHFSTWADGTILQSRDTLYQSGANLDGNHRVIAIENADMPPSWNTGDGHAVPAMTAAQIEACARIVAWANQTHGIPLVANPDSRPESRGIGYHRQGVDGDFLSNGYAYPGRVSGGELWTTSPGKVCPGDRRISQVPQIISRAIAITGEDDMPTADEVAQAVWNYRLPDSLNGGEALALWLLSGAHQGANRTWLVDVPDQTTDPQSTAQAQWMLSGIHKTVTETAAAITAGLVADVDEEALAAALVAQGVAGGATPAQVKAALAEVLTGGTVAVPPA